MIYHWEKGEMLECLMFEADKGCLGCSFVAGVFVLFAIGAAIHGGHWAELAAYFGLMSFILFSSWLSDKFD